VNLETIKGTQLLQRAFEIINLLAKNPKGLNLSKISEFTSIPISTAHRILQFLIQNDYIRNNKITGQNYLGSRFVLFSSVFFQNFDFLKEIRPGIINLNEEFDETVHIGILNNKGSKVIYIDKQESSRAVRMFSIIGQTVPIHCTSLGKALFASLTAQESNEILERYDFQKFTETTITKKKDFLIEIEKVKKLGYAVDNRENENNIICYGKSFYNHYNQTTAAVSISIPDYRFGEKNIERVVESLTNTVEWFEKKLAILQL